MSAITHDMIVQSEKQDLFKYRQQLNIAKMKLDKFFTIFLDNSDLREDEPNTTDWQVYREMTKEYEKVNHLIRSTEYYLGKHA